MNEDASGYKSYKTKIHKRWKKEEEDEWRYKRCLKKLERASTWPSIVTKEETNKTD